MHQTAATKDAVSRLTILAADVEVVTKAPGVSDIIQCVWNYLLVAEEPRDGGGSNADLEPEFVPLACVPAAMQQKVSN